MGDNVTGLSMYGKINTRTDRRLAIACSLTYYLVRSICLVAIQSVTACHAWEGEITDAESSFFSTLRAVQGWGTRTCILPFRGSVRSFFVRCRMEVSTAPQQKIVMMSVVETMRTTEIMKARTNAQANGQPKKHTEKP